MDLSFERGDPERPCGHAVIYFRGPADPEAVAATYLIVLPVAVDLAKYLPPFLAGQVPNLGEAGLSAFAFPPAPEPAASHTAIAEMAEARGDDLLFGGIHELTDVTGLMTVVAELVEEYAGRYEAAVGQIRGADDGPELPAGEEVGGTEGVDDVVYGLMSEADRLGELTKLAGRLRFATEGGDTATATDAEARIKALARHMPTNRRIDRILAAAGDRSPDGARVAQLYLERAYCLLREDYLRVKAIDVEISTIDRGSG